MSRALCLYGQRGSCLTQWHSQGLLDLLLDEIISRDPDRNSKVMCDLLLGVAHCQLSLAQSHGRVSGEQWPSSYNYSEIPELTVLEIQGQDLALLILLARR